MSDVTANVVVTTNPINVQVNSTPVQVTPNAIQLNVFSGGSANPGGATGQLQYNRGGGLEGVPYTNVANGNVSFTNINTLKIAGGTNGYVLQTDGTGNLTWTAQRGNGGGNGNATPGGANTEIQYNNAGNFAGLSGFTLDNTTGNVSIPGNLYVVGNITGGGITTVPNYANYSGYVVNSTQGNITQTGNLVYMQIGNNTLNTVNWQYYPNTTTINVQGTQYPAGSIRTEIADAANIGTYAGQDAIIQSYDVANNTGGGYNINYFIQDTANTASKAVFGSELFYPYNYNPGDQGAAGYYQLSLLGQNSDTANGDFNTATTYSVGNPGLNFAVANPAEFPAGTPIVAITNYGVTGDSQVGSTGLRFTRRRGNGNARQSLVANDYLGNIEWRGATANGAAPTNGWPRIAPRVDANYVTGSANLPVSINISTVDNSNTYTTIFSSNGSVTLPGAIYVSSNSVALGNLTAGNVDANYAVAIGYQTGAGPNSVSIGRTAGALPYLGTRADGAVAIGNAAAAQAQKEGGVAIGDNAGTYNQSGKAIAIGSYAGANSQGIFSIAIGAYSGNANAQSNNSIIINATGNELDAPTANAFYVKPIRGQAQDNQLYYDITTGEITYSTSGTVASAATVTNNAQPNITSVGTLTSLNVSGTITAANITANTGVFTGNGSGLSQIVGANVTGYVPNANIANTAYSVAGANVSGQVGNALVAGTVYTNAQPNITSVGQLTSLLVSGNIQSGNGTTGTGNIFAFGNISTLSTLLANTITSNSNIFANTGIVKGQYLYGDGSNISNISVANISAITNGNSNVSVKPNANINISSNGVANVLVVTSTGANIAGTLNATGNANVGNIGATNAVFTNISGNGNSITNIQAANIVGTIANANYSAYANIATTAYSVSASNITGTINFATYAGTANAVAGANVSGAVAYATTANSVAGANVSGKVANAIYADQAGGATIAGTVTSNSQPNITGVGSLGNLNVINSITANGTITANAGLISVGANGYVNASSITTNVEYLTPTSYATLNGLKAAGARGICIDANTTTFYATVGGGGSNTVPIFYNGTVWKVG